MPKQTLVEYAIDAISVSRQQANRVIWYQIQIILVQLGDCSKYELYADRIGRVTDRIGRVAAQAIRGQCPAPHGAV